MRYRCKFQLSIGWIKSWAMSACVNIWRKNKVGSATESCVMSCSALRLALLVVVEAEGAWMAEIFARWLSWSSLFLQPSFPCIQTPCVCHQYSVFTCKICLINCWITQYSNAVNWYGFFRCRLCYESGRDVNKLVEIKLNIIIICVCVCVQREREIICNIVGLW